MSRWAYDTDYPPPQAWEAVAGAAQLLKADAAIVGALGSADQIYADEDPDSEPLNERYVVVREYQELGARPVEDSGLLTVRLHVKVVCPLELPAWRRWHAAMHARVARALVGARPALTLSGVGWTGVRQTHEPSRPETYEEDTRESFALYAITLQTINAE